MSKWQKLWHSDFVQTHTAYNFSNVKSKFLTFSEVQIFYAKKKQLLFLIKFNKRLNEK